MKGEVDDLSNQHIEALRRFNARVERIRGFSISELLEQGLLKTAVQVALGEDGPTTIHPSTEQIDAFVNNLRFFIQNNEATSFQRISQSYLALGLPADLKQQFDTCETRLNGWLDSKSPLGFGGTALTNGRILEVFVYGEIAHSNRDKREELEHWRESPPFFNLLETHFLNIMAKFIEFLNEAAAINARALRDLSR